MTVTREGKVVVLTGPCRVEDAEPLTVLLQAAPDAVLDLSACEALHSAVVQAILAFRPDIQGASANPFIADWLSPLLKRS